MNNKLHGKITERDILEFAIEIERKAAETYLKAAETVADPKAKGLLIGMAQEERDHEIMLKNLIDRVEAAKPLPNSFSQPQTREFDDSIKHMEIGPESTVDDIILYAMGREKALMEIYETFAHLLKAGEFRDLCEFLAGEEQKHLNGFEELYHHERKAAG